MLVKRGWHVVLSFAIAWSATIAGMSVAADAPAKSPKKASAAAPAGKSKAAASTTTVTSEAKPTQTAVDPLDWPNWRGPEQNRMSRETGLMDKWNATTGEGVLWENKEAGGISTPIVMRGKLYTIVRAEPDTVREGEKVLCLDAATGKKLWENRFNVYLSDVPAERVGWSSCVGDPNTGKVYVQGVSGYFACIDGDSGQTMWSRSLHEEFGILSTYGGRTNVPVVFEDLVITSAVITGWGESARPAHRFIAMNKGTGEVVWFNGTKPLPEDTTFSTPTLTVLDGQAAMVFGSSDGAVWAFQPRTGKPIWNFRLSRRGLNVSPLVVGDTVYMAQNEENLDNVTMGCLVAINGKGQGDITETNQLWMVKGITDGKSAPLLVDDRVYVADDTGNFYIVDAKTGEKVGRPAKLTGTIVRGSPLYADGKIYMCTTSAWNVMEPTKTGVKFVQKMRMTNDDEVTGSVIVSHGRFYIPSTHRLICVGAADYKPTEVAPLKVPAETAHGEGRDVAAQVQVVPAEILVRSGEKVKYRVNLFNERGQRVDSKEATFSLEGPGEIDADGNFVAPTGKEHTATIVTATVGKLTGKARVRTIPPLPWKFDFDNVPLAANPKGVTEGEPPVTWIGARVRYKVRSVDGENVMVKLSTIPKGTRSQSWMGPIDLHDYTTQADMKGELVDKKLPDMGVIAQRYTLDVMGENQQLQIRSWPPQVKNGWSKTVDFAWKPNVWYTVKLQASRLDNGKKALLRGKVWPRDEKEPAQWSIEAEDEAPNLQGSPGLFGNATNAEIFIDNVQVYENKTTAQASAR